MRDKLCRTPDRSRRKAGLKSHSNFEQETGTRSDDSTAIARNNQQDMRLCSVDTPAGEKSHVSNDYKSQFENVQ